MAIANETERMMHFIAPPNEKAAGFNTPQSHNYLLRTLVHAACRWIPRSICRGKKKVRSAQ
jgi:hypothetical protein